MVVTTGGLDLDDTVADFEQRDVERSATEVEDEDRLLDVALVETVGQCCRGRLVDDAQDVQACDLTGLLGGLALSVAEVRRHGDDGVGDALAEVGLCIALELHQRASADLLRGVCLAVDVLGPGGTHVTLDRADGALDVGHGLALGDFADQHLAVLREGDDGRGSPGALSVCDDDGLAAFEDRDNRVRRAQVNSHCSRHGVRTPFVLPAGAGSSASSLPLLRTPCNRWRIFLESGGLISTPTRALPWIFRFPAAISRNLRESCPCGRPLQPGRFARHVVRLTLIWGDLVSAHLLLAPRRQ